MSARGKTASPLSPALALVFLLCVCGVGLHFLSDGLVPTNSWSGAEPIAQTAVDHVTDEDSGDLYIFPILTGLTTNSTFLQGLTPISSRAFTFYTSPLLPPPDL